eukprot:4470044-Amphidinium_carterae.1
MQAPNLSKQHTLLSHSSGELLPAPTCNGASPTHTHTRTHARTHARTHSHTHALLYTAYGIVRVKYWWKARKEHHQRLGDGYSWGNSSSMSVLPNFVTIASSGAKSSK